MRRILLITLAIAFLGLMVLLPVAAIFFRAFSGGAGTYVMAIIEPETLAAIRLTVIASLIVVPINIIFGVAAAWLVARYRFFGRRFLLILVELPFAMSPIVVGLSFLLVYGAYGPVGAILEPYGIQLTFNLVGIVLVSLFVTCPFVMREVLPILMVTGEEEEKAALTLGASGWQIFRFIIAPNISWGLAYGTMLTMARAMGEFGAVSVISGAIRGRTMTLPLQIELLYNDYNTTGAFAAATILTLLAFMTLIIRSILNRFGPQKEVRL